LRVEGDVVFFARKGMTKNKDPISLTIVDVSVGRILFFSHRISKEHRIEHHGRQENFSFERICCQRKKFLSLLFFPSSELRSKRKLCPSF
jgi:hypothetical protein